MVKYDPQQRACSSDRSERHPLKVKVRGSNPFTHTKLNPGIIDVHITYPFSFLYHFFVQLKLYYSVIQFENTRMVRVEKRGLIHRWVIILVLQYFVVYNGFKWGEVGF